MQVKNLNFKHAKNAPYFFKDLSFKLEEGKIHALHGKNGMGKTVLLNLLCGKKAPESIIEGEVTGGHNTMLVNQRFDKMIVEQFTFEENLKFASMERFPNPFAKLKAPHLHLDILEKFNIEPTMPVSKLSGGQRQILSLLMVLQKKVNILLLDEPTATLDEENAKMVFEFLRTLSEQRVTLLIVCHDRELINQYVTGRHLQLAKSPCGLRHLT
jgi:ABC-type multidrug transport system ATPase subunit